MSSSELTDTARRRWLLGAAGSIGLSASGCGFQLQREPVLSFRSIALSGFAARSPLALELRLALARQVEVQESTQAAQLILQAMTDVRERSIVAQTASAQVRTMQLRIKLQYRVQTPAGRELIPAAWLLQARDMSYKEELALAKQIEEGELYREMQSDIVLQVLRRLAAVKV